MDNNYRRHRPTRIYSNQHTFQIAVEKEKKWRNSIKGSYAYNTFDSIGSDHRIVRCKGQISYRKSKPPEKGPMKLIDW